MESSMPAACASSTETGVVAENGQQTHQPTRKSIPRKRAPPKELYVIDSNFRAKEHTSTRRASQSQSGRGRRKSTFDGVSCNLPHCKCQAPAFSIHEQFDRWRHLMTDLKVGNHTDVAKILLDTFDLYVMIVLASQDKRSILLPHLPVPLSQELVDVAGRSGTSTSVPRVNDCHVVVEDVTMIDQDSNTRSYFRVSFKRLEGRSNGKGTLGSEQGNSTISNSAPLKMMIPAASSDTTDEESESCQENEETCPPAEFTNTPEKKTGLSLMQPEIVAVIDHEEQKKHEGNKENNGNTCNTQSHVKTINVTSFSITGPEESTLLDDEDKSKEYTCTLAEADNGQDGILHGQTGLLGIPGVDQEMFDQEGGGFNLPVEYVQNSEESLIGSERCFSMWQRYEKENMDQEEEFESLSDGITESDEDSDGSSSLSGAEFVTDVNPDVKKRRKKAESDEDYDPAISGSNTSEEESESDDGDISDDSDAVPGAEYPCPYADCRSVLKSESSLKSHETRTHSHLRCNICVDSQEIFKSGNDLRTHMKEKHNIHKLEMDTAICDLCGKKVRYLDKHKIAKHNPESLPKFFCPEKDCKYFARNKKSVNNHLQWKHGILKKHKGARKDNQVCTVCGKIFRTMKALSKHMMFHNDERPYKCDFPLCSLSFRSGYDLRIHKMRHSDAKPMSCELCDFTCRQRNSMNWHMRKKHNMIKEVDDFGKTVYKHARDRSTNSIEDF